MRFTHSLFGPIVLVLLSIGMVRALAQQAKHPGQDYCVDVSVTSMNPDVGLTTFKDWGKLSGMKGSTLGTGVRNDSLDFKINIQVASQQGRFVAFVSVVPNEKDKKTKASQQKFDLTDLRAKSYEVARDDEGRVYQISLVPRIVTYPLPRTFDPRAFHLEEMNFSNSPVILNDKEFLGTVGMGGAAVASIQMPGVGDVEFSLLHLKDAQPQGQLEKGVLTIHHEKQVLVISNVTNGDRHQILEGGPFQVWVRWKSAASLEDQRRSLLESIAEMKKKAASGKSTLSDDVLQRIQELDPENLPRFITSGARSPNPGEVVPAQD